jgi:hypothetical protein
MLSSVVAIDIELHLFIGENNDTRVHCSYRYFIEGLV